MRVGSDLLGEAILEEALDKMATGLVLGKSDNMSFDILQARYDVLNCNTRLDASKRIRRLLESDRWKAYHPSRSLTL